MLVKVDPQRGLHHVGVIDDEPQAVAPVGNAFVVVALVSQAAEEAAEVELADVLGPLTRLVVIAQKHNARLGQPQRPQPGVVVRLALAERIQCGVELIGSSDDRPFEKFALVGRHRVAAGVVAPVQPAQQVVGADVSAAHRAAALGVPLAGLQCHLLGPADHLRVIGQHRIARDLLKPSPRAPGNLPRHLAVPVDPRRPAGIAEHVRPGVLGHAPVVKPLGAADKLGFAPVGDVRLSDLGISQQAWAPCPRQLLDGHGRGDEAMRLGQDGHPLDVRPPLGKLAVAVDSPVPRPRLDRLLGCEEV